MPVFVGELLFHEDFVEKAGYLSGGIAEGTASEGSEHQGVVAVCQTYAQDGADLVADVPATDMKPSSRGSSIRRNPLPSSSRNIETEGV